MQMDIQEITTLSPSELQKYAQHVGHTPMQALQLMNNGRAYRICLKLEGANPTGSMKDRTGYALVQSLEEQEKLRAGSIVIESTSGNLGVALALQCKARGLDFLAIVDPKTTQENIAKMQTLDAHIDVVDQPDEMGGYLLSRLERVREYCCRSGVYAWTNQYENPANVHIHYVSTGPEIYRQMNGHIDAVFVPVSTGGTLAGVGRFLREVSPSTRIIGVDAYGSVIFGTPPAPRKLTGIGSSRPSSFLSPDLYDTYILVRDEEAFAFCRALSDATNLRVGGSSGAALAACIRYLAVYPDLKDIVCICADKGENYASSIFNDAWLEHQKLCLSKDLLSSIQEMVCLPSLIF